jgi:hypothetical protein
MGVTRVKYVILRSLDESNYKLKIFNDLQIYLFFLP